MAATPAKPAVAATASPPGSGGGKVADKVAAALKLYSEGNDAALHRLLLHETDAGLFGKKVKDCPAQHVLNLLVPMGLSWSKADEKKLFASKVVQIIQDPETGKAFPDEPSKEAIEQMLGTTVMPFVDNGGDPKYMGGYGYVLVVQDRAALT